MARPLAPLASKNGKSGAGFSRPFKKPELFLNVTANRRSIFLTFAVNTCDYSRKATGVFKRTEQACLCHLKPPRTILDPAMMNTDDALTRAGLGFILGRISHLETIHPKSQAELDELAALETIRNRYYCKMVRLAASCFPFLALVCLPRQTDRQKTSFLELTQKISRVVERQSSSRTPDRAALPTSSLQPVLRSTPSPPPRRTRPSSSVVQALPCPSRRPRLPTRTTTCRSPSPGSCASPRPMPSCIARGRPLSPRMPSSSSQPPRCCPACPSQPPPRCCPACPSRRIQ